MNKIKSRTPYFLLSSLFILLSPSLSTASDPQLELPSVPPPSSSLPASYILLTDSRYYPDTIPFLKSDYSAESEPEAKEGKSDKTKRKDTDAEEDFVMIGKEDLVSKDELLASSSRFGPSAAYLPTSESSFNLGAPGDGSGVNLVYIRQSAWLQGLKPSLQAMVAVFRLLTPHVDSPWLFANYGPSFNRRKLEEKDKDNEWISKAILQTQDEDGRFSLKSPGIFRYSEKRDTFVITFASYSNISYWEHGTVLCLGDWLQAYGIREFPIKMFLPCKEPLLALLDEFRGKFTPYTKVVILEEPVSGHWFATTQRTGLGAQAVRVTLEKLKEFYGTFDNSVANRLTYVLMSDATKGKIAIERSIAEELGLSNVAYLHETLAEKNLYSTWSTELERFVNPMDIKAYQQLKEKAAAPPTTDSPYALEQHIVSAELIEAVA